MALASRRPAGRAQERSGRFRRFRWITRISGQEPLSGLVIAAVMFGIWALGVAQAGLLARMSLPLGATAPVLVSVLALAHALGPVRGALFGAWAGLVLDLIPPAAGPVGGWALILTLAGLTMGHVCQARQPGPWLSIGLIGIAATSVVAMRAVLLWFAGHSPALFPALLVALCAGGTAVVLAPVGLLGAQVVAAGRRPRSRGRPSGPLEPVPLEPVLKTRAAMWQMTDGYPVDNPVDNPESVANQVFR